MSGPVFVKHYSDPTRGRVALAHLRWPRQLDSGVRLPRCYPSTATDLVLEWLDGRLPEPHDLPGPAGGLGRLHGCAYARELHTARLDQPFEARTGIVIPDFPAGRGHALAQLGHEWRNAPAAFYKDANRRNFLITPAGPALVDFDDLTLAPFGYDLAKLIVSTAMTFGALPKQQVDAALTVYTRGAEEAGGPVGACTGTQLAGYCEVHHVLTARYLHRNGYQHPWPTVRPWPPPPAQPA